MYVRNRQEDFRGSDKEENVARQYFLSLLFVAEVRLVRVCSSYTAFCPTSSFSEKAYKSMVDSPIFVSDSTMFLARKVLICNLSLCPR